MACNQPEGADSTSHACQNRGEPACFADHAYELSLHQQRGPAVIAGPSNTARKHCITLPGPCADVMGGLIHLGGRAEPGTPTPSRAPVQCRCTALPCTAFCSCDIGPSM